MGLIKAAISSVGGTFADQWKEFIYCDSIPNDVLAVRGRKKTSGRSSNTKGNDNIITSGSGIAVADGQCMIIVEQGRIAEICAEPGEFTFDASTAETPVRISAYTTLIQKSLLIINSVRRILFLSGW